MSGHDPKVQVSHCIAKMDIEFTFQGTLGTSMFFCLRSCFNLRCLYEGIIDILMPPSDAITNLKAKHVFLAKFKDGPLKVHIYDDTENGISRAKNKVVIAP